MAENQVNPQENVKKMVESLEQLPDIDVVIKWKNILGTIDNILSGFYIPITITVGSKAQVHVDLGYNFKANLHVISDDMDKITVQDIVEKAKETVINELPNILAEMVSELKDVLYKYKNCLEDYDY